MINIDFNQTGCEYVDWIYVVAVKVQWQIRVETKVKYEFLVTLEIHLLAYSLHAPQYSYVEVGGYERITKYPL